MKEDTAKDLAGRAGKQAKNAAKNSGRAAKTAAEPAVEAVADEVRDAADKVEETVDEAVRAARHVKVGVLGQTAIGVLALTMAIYSGSIAYGQFRYVIGYRKGVALAKQDINK